MLTLKGDLDAFTVQQIRERLNQCIESGQLFIVLNCSQVNYINSTAIGVLVGRMRHIRMRGGELALAELNERVDRIITLVGGRRLFLIYDTEHEAVAHLAEKQRSQEQASESEQSDGLVDPDSWVLNSR